LLKGRKRDVSGRFAGKSIVITGGGAGLGRECALQWSAEGGRIVVTDLVEDRAQAVAKDSGVIVAKA
jgi:NAD(P)-dependent dehydrogenase (short-subunit alcohol dehydrogenase family)